MCDTIRPLSTRKDMFFNFSLPRLNEQGVLQWELYHEEETCQSCPASCSDVSGPRSPTSTSYSSHQDIPRSEWAGACGEVKSVKKGKNGAEEFRFDIYKHVDHGGMKSVNFVDTFFNDGSDRTCRGVIKPGAQMCFGIKHKKNELWIKDCSMGL